MAETLARLIGICVLAWMAGVPSRADGQTAAGRVISVRPPASVTIRHPGGASEPARTGILLHSGDQFEIGVGAIVRAVVFGYEETYDYNRRDKKIPDHDVGFFDLDDAGFLAGLQRFLGQARRSIPVFPQARGSSAPEHASLAYDRLIAESKQFISPDAKRIALIWRNGSAVLDVAVPGSPPVTVDSNDQAWALIPVAPGMSTLSIAADSGRLKWSIERGSKPPSPPWFKGHNVQLSEAQRLTRAVWLLRRGPAEWHLFAITELAELADAGNFTATQVWQAVRSGEWTSETMDGR